MKVGSKAVSKIKKKPQRMCVTCKERKDKKDLLRVVLLARGLRHKVDPDDLKRVADEILGLVGKEEPVEDGK